MSSVDERYAVAVIGMEGRFPGARSIEEYWENLCAGRESVTRFERDELDHSVSTALRSDPAYVPVRGVLDDALAFDAGFFGITPREAELMDPQQRVFLELCWSALERSGYDPQRFDGSIGVYAGMSNNTYYLSSVLSHPDKVQRFGEFQTMLANEKDFLATRVSHKLDLRGPSISMYTGCSTSLVAVTQAFHALLSFQTDMALAGGVCITTPQNSGYLHRPEGIESEDGHCRPFDSRATGTIFSNGAGVVVLKRLEDARRDGDQIRAVLVGAALNNDGAGKVGFAAPSVTGQAEVIADALAQGEVDPSTVGYVEAHGTATKLGDPVEIEGLRQAFHFPHSGRGRCALGSVKGNFGHLLAAAGVAGLIKAILVVENNQVPPTVNFDAPNPAVDLENSPFFINRETVAFPDRGGPRRAGVSSFGIGGTNAHVVIEQAPETQPADSSDRPELLVLSARSDAALSRQMSGLTRFLEAQPGCDLAAASFTLQSGRRAFPHRFFAVVDRVENPSAVLDSPAANASGRAHYQGESPEVLFLFPDLDDLFDIKHDPYQKYGSVYKKILEDLEAGIDPAERSPGSLPHRFIMSYALAKTWMAWGLQPRALVSQGLGEVVAACVSGVLDPQDALRFLARLSERSAESSDSDDSESGRLDEGLWAVCAAMKFGRPKLPWFSSVSGRLTDWSTASDPTYWTRLPRVGRRFGEAVAAATAGGVDLVLEAGPASSPGAQIFQEASSTPAKLIPALPDKPCEAPAGWRHVLAGLGHCWLAGCDIHWAALHSTPGRRMALPTYPFERDIHSLPTRPSVERTHPVAEI